MPRHIPPGKEDLWRAQAHADDEVTRLEKAINAAERKARELAAVLDPDDSIVEDADAEVERLYDEHGRATAVANRVYDERMAGLTSWIDTDPTAPICGQCHGAGRRPGTRGGDVADACPGCRGWGRTYVEPVPVWNEQKQQWVNPATGRSVDLLADPEPKKSEPPRTTGSTGETGMTNIEGARAAIMSGHQSAEQALNELMQAHRSLEDSQNGLRQGTEGSNQAEADQAHAQLTEALNKIDEARQQVASALQEFEGVANRL